MGFLLLYFVILIVSTNTNTQDILEHADSSSSNVQITVPYTLWVGTAVTQQYNINITIPQYTSFFDVMKLAQEQNPKHFSFEATNFPQYGHFITSIGGHHENSTTKVHWLLYVLTEAPDVNNPPLLSALPPVGVDNLLVKEGKYYLFWLRNVDFPPQ